MRELSNIASVKSIDIRVNNYKKWVRNSLSILTSSKDYEYNSYLSLNDSKKIIRKINFENKKLENLDFVWRNWRKISDYNYIQEKYKKKCTRSN